MNFCSNCGQPVELRVPPGDHLPRFVCGACGTIHYQNPRIVAGCVPVFEDRILMCRRAIEPRRGFWTFPAGFMENGETTQDAARRESVEEALAEVEIGSLLSVVHVLHADQVHVTFRAQSAAARIRSGPGEPRSGAVRRSRAALVRNRVPERRFRACGASSRTVAQASRRIISRRSTCAAAPAG